MVTIFLAIIKLFFIIFLGFYLYRRKVLKEEALSFITTFVINISIPSLVFSNIITHFQPDKLPSPLIFIGLSIGIFLLGFILGVFFSFKIPQSIRREFITLTSFQNCGYLPMNIAVFLLSSPLRETFLTYIFLYILGFNILMWSIGTFLIFKRKEETFKMTSMFTPPILSTIISLGIVYLGLKEAIPSIILSPLKAIGETSFVLSMIILGAWLAKSRAKTYLYSLSVWRVAIVKLVLLPAVMFTIIIRNNLFSLIGMFIILESSMPSAASLPIVVSLRGGDSKFISCGVFLTHILGVVTVPFWIELFLRISNLKI